MKRLMIIQFGLLALLLFPASLLAVVHEDFEKYEEPVEDSVDLQRFIISENIFSSSVTTVSEGFSGITYDAPGPVNLISPEIMMPDTNGSVEYVRNFSVVVDEDSSPESHMSSSFSLSDYSSFNAVYLSYTIEPDEEVILYNADPYFIKVLSSNDIGSLDTTPGTWVMIPRTKSIALEVITNGNDNPPGTVEITAVGTYTLPNMGNMDPDFAGGYEFASDQSEKMLWVLEDAESLPGMETLKSEDSIVLQAEKILSTIENSVIWDGTNWNSLKYPWDIEGNPGAEYAPEAPYGDIYAGRNINALLAYAHSDEGRTNKLLVSGSMAPAISNFEDVPPVDNDPRRFVLLSEWVKYKLDQQYGWGVHQPTTVGFTECSTVYSCPFSPVYPNAEKTLYPTYYSAVVDDPNIELNEQVSAGSLHVTMDAPSGGETGGPGMPLVTFYNSNAVGNAEPSNILLLEYHDLTNDTFDGEVSNALTPIIVNDTGVVYNTLASLYGRDSSEEITWQSENDMIIEWGGGRIRIFINNELAHTAFYSGTLTIDRAYVGGVPDVDLFEDYELIPPVPSNVSLFTTEKDNQYQLFAGTGQYVFEEDRYPNMPRGIPVSGILELGTIACGNQTVAQFSGNNGNIAQIVTSGCDLSIEIAGQSATGTIPTSGDAEVVWTFNTLNGQTVFQVYINGALIAATTPSYGFNATLLGTLFEPGFTIQTSGGFDLWQKFVYANDLIVEETSRITGYKVYISDSKEEVENRTITPKVVSANELRKYLQSEINMGGLDNDALNYVGITSFYKQGESNISNIDSFVSAVREDINPPVPRGAAEYLQETLSGSDMNLCFNASGRDHLLFSTAFAQGGQESETVKVETNIYNVPLGENLVLDASLSTDNGDRVDGEDYKKYAWSLGMDINYDTSSKPRHMYLYPGTYTVMLEVRDDNGAKGYDYSKVIVDPPADMTLKAFIEVGTDESMTPFTNDTIAPGETLYFEGTSEDYYGDSGLYDWEYIWDFADGTQEEDTEVAKNAVLAATGEPLAKVPIAHSFDYPGVYPVNLTITGPQGNTGIYQYTIVVEGVHASADYIEIAGSGVPYTIGISGGKAPYTINGPGGSETLDTPGQIMLNLQEGSWTVTDALGNTDTFEVSEGENNTPANTPPAPEISMENISGKAPMNIYPTITGNADQDGYIDMYAWNFGDGIPWKTKINLPATDAPQFLSDNPKVITQTFEALGTYPGILTVQDANGNMQKQNFLINVNPNSVTVQTEQGVVAGKTTIGAAQIQDNITLQKQSTSGEIINVATVELDKKGGFVYVPQTNPEVVTGGVRIGGDDGTHVVMDSAYGVHLIQTTDISTEIDADGNIQYSFSMEPGTVDLTLVPDKNQSVRFVQEIPFSLEPGVYMVLREGIQLEEDERIMIADSEGTPMISWDNENQFSVLRDLTLEATTIQTSKQVFAKEYLATRVRTNDTVIVDIIVLPNQADGNNLYEGGVNPDQEGYYFSMDTDEENVDIQKFTGDYFNIQPGDKLEIVIQDKNGNNVTLDGSIEMSEEILSQKGPIVGVNTVDYQEIIDFSQTDFYINDADPVMFGTGTPGSIVTIKTPRDSREIEVNAQGSWKADVMLGPEPAFVEFYHDSARLGSINFILDTVSPEAPRLTAWKGTVLQGVSEPLSIIGYLIDNQDIDTASVDEEGAFVFMVPTHTQEVTLVALDQAGNASPRVTYTPQTDLQPERSLLSTLWSKQFLGILIVILAFIGLYWVRKQA